MGYYLYDYWGCFGFGVVVVLKVLPFLSCLFIFVFTAFLFPYVESYSRNVNQSLTFAPVIEAFPYVLLGIVALFLVYFGIARGKD